MAQITGRLIQANGEPISGAIITVNVKQHSSVVGGDIVKGTFFDVACEEDGSYSFPLSSGSYYIQIKIGSTVVDVDDVVVDDTTPDGADILDLTAHEGVSVELARQILNEATSLSMAEQTAVMSVVLNNDGVGSGVDADLFQGKTLAEVTSEAQNEAKLSLLNYIVVSGNQILSNTLKSQNIKLLGVG